MKRAWLVLVCCGCLIEPVSAETWRVKNFEVFEGEPNTTYVKGYDFLAGESFYWEHELYYDPEHAVFGDSEVEPSIPLPPPIKADIEKFLSEAAHTLEEWGFKPPLVQPVLKNEQGEIYIRVYYRDFPEDANGKPDTTPARWRADQCGKFRPTIELNAQVFLDNNGKVKPKSYQDLAHELFHGIQARYPLFKERCNDKAGDWLYEGTAQALGADVAAWGPRKLNDPHNRRDGWIVFRWGIRDYNEPLYMKEYHNDPQQRIAYGTSSFWRFLGEFTAKNRQPDLLEVKPDYQYLIDFMNSTLGGPPSLESSMAWIDEQLTHHKNFELGLERMYTHFISLFAVYGGTRIRPPEFGHQYNERWLEAIFLDAHCPVVELSKDNSSLTLPLRITAYASRCFRVRTDFAFNTGLHVSITGDSKAAVEAVSYGTKGGEVYVRSIPHPFENRWKGNSSFEVPAGLTRTVVFTNIPLQSVNTEKFSGTVEFSVSRGEHNWAVYGPMPQPYGPQPPSGQGTVDSSSGAGNSTPQTSRRATVAAELEAGMETLNPNTVHGNRMQRNADAKPCRNPFESAACGPHTTVRLEMMPGNFGSLMTSTGRGGIFGQFTSMMSGLAASEMMVSSDKAQAALERAENMDASRVVLRFPLIDYGFSGTFRNALIVANRKGGGAWESVEPGEGDPSTGQGPKLTGQVTIQEYTPTILLGSYSGTLVESYESGEETGNEVPATRFINGTFQVVATWAGDDRIKVVLDEADVIMDDLTDQFGVSTSGYEVIQVGDRQEVVPKQGNTASATGGGAAGDCSCECDMRGKVDDLCEMFCEEAFAACD